MQQVVEVARMLVQEQLIVILHKKVVKVNFIILQVMHMLVVEAPLVFHIIHHMKQIHLRVDMEVVVMVLCILQHLKTILLHQVNQILVVEEVEALNGMDKTQQVQVEVVLL